MKLTKNYKPHIIGHRGACGYMPENTIEGYKLALDLDVTHIEPDIVMTRDGVLIAKHETMLSINTDVADRKEFENRKTTKNIDGEMITDWFASDFDLHEIKTLKAYQQVVDRPQEHNGKFSFLTLEEIIQFIQQESINRGKEIGVYLEIKHASFHNNLGLKIEDEILKLLDKYNWNHADAPIYIQCFEVSGLQYIREKSSVKIMQLIDASYTDEKGDIVLDPPHHKPYDFVLNNDERTFKDLLTEEGLDFVKSYANGVSVWKSYIIKPVPKKIDENGDYKLEDSTGETTDLIDRVHANGLRINAFTFKNERRFLLNNYSNNPSLEYRKFFELGIDGVFTDFPDVARKALQE